MHLYLYMGNLTYLLIYTPVNIYILYFVPIRTINIPGRVCPGYGCRSGGHPIHPYIYIYTTYTQILYEIYVYIYIIIVVVLR